MKLDTANIHTSSNIQSEAEFGMDKKDMPHITNLLRKQIYSDKLMAIIREYATNAYDAHVDANIEQIPIEVTLPTMTNQNLSIRDFGEGLTEEEVMKIYIKYGASTKRNSNSVTGCLGIGCKSGFAYSTQFTITTYKNNVETQYLARIDENNIGTISMLSAQHTDESNGVKVTIPIKQSDHEDLKSKAITLFKHWKTRPKINLEIPKLEYLKKGDTWCIVKTNDDYYRRRDSSATFFMGNIPYKVDTGILSSSDSGVNSALNCSTLVVYAPLGSLDIAASREALEYTSRTKNTLIAMAKTIITEISAEINDELKSVTSPITAAIRAVSYMDDLEYELRNVIREGITFDGQRLKNKITFGHEAVKHSRSHRYRANDYVNKRETDIRSVGITGGMHFCLWDPNDYSETNATRRIRTLQHEGGWDNDATYYLIKWENKDKILPRLQDEDIINLADILPLKPNRTIIAKDGSTVKKTKISVCSLQPSHLKSGRLSENIDNPAPNNADGKYHYVPLDRFDWVGKTGDPLANLGCIQGSIKILARITKGYKDYCPTIYGVKKHHVKHIKDNPDWIELDKYLLELWEDAKAKLPKACENAHWCQSTTDSYIPSGYATLKVLRKCANKDIRRLVNIAWNDGLSNYVELDDWDEDTASVGRMLNTVVDTLQACDIIKLSEGNLKLAEKLEKQHPLISMINIGYGADNDPNTLKAINEYLNRK